MLYELNLGGIIDISKISYISKLKDVTEDGDSRESSIIEVVVDGVEITIVGETKEVEKERDNLIFKIKNTRSFPKVAKW